MDIPDYLCRAIESVKLSILVFGPDPLQAQDPTSTYHLLAKKRIQIRDELVAKGHQVYFPEDLLVGRNRPPPGEVLIYERVLVDQHDVVFLLVASPGTNVELGYFGAMGRYAKKLHAYINRHYNAGLAADTCIAVKQNGGGVEFFDSPKDLDECHLLTNIASVVAQLQRQKYFY